MQDERVRGERVSGESVVQGERGNARDNDGERVKEDVK